MRFNGAGNNVQISDALHNATNLFNSTISNGAVLTPFRNPNFNNTDKSTYKTVIEHLDAQRNKFTVKPFRVTLLQEDIDQGAPEEISIPITFDQSNFFA